MAFPAATRGLPVLAATIAAALTLAACSDAGHAEASRACATEVAQTLGVIAQRTYHETVASDQTRSAVDLVARSRALSRAVARNDPLATSAAVYDLLRTNHVAAMRVMRGGKILADLGDTPALTGISGRILGPRHRVVGRYVISTASDRAYIVDLQGLIGGYVQIASGDRVLAGAPPGAADAHLPTLGEVRIGTTEYAVDSFVARDYPLEAPIAVSVLTRVADDGTLCGASQQQTVANTVGNVSSQIYHQEAYSRQTGLELRRAATYKPLLAAVAAGQVHASEVAIDQLLNQHIVRIRVLRGGRFLADVGGPHVLAPARAPLIYRGRTIGSVVISIQDDLGYLLLVHRLLGARVIMWEGKRQVISSLGQRPVAPPQSGRWVYGKRAYTVYSFAAEAFPAGALTIHVLIPHPYQ